jgi:phosphoheptose isomerase
VITFHALGRVRRIHQGRGDAFPDERFEIEDLIVNHADHIIAECPQDKDDLLNLYHADPARITTIPCGFDPAELRPLDKTLSRRALNIPEKERVILQLGRMVPRKGVDTVVRGFARLLKQHHIPARLIIVGGESEDPNPQLTPEIGRLQSIAEEEGVANRVTFIGRRDRQALKHYYSAADIFVSTPWYEPFGITPVEAMACGTPVIGSKVGGIMYTVRHGQTGYLIQPNDPTALGQRLAYLYQHPEKLQQFSRQAVKRANEQFTWKKVGESIAALYEEVLTSLPERAEDLEQDMITQQELVIQQGFENAVKVLSESRQALSKSMLETAQTIVNCLLQGGKILVCGNGGSAADAQHFAAELVGRFIHPDRQGLPVIALSADSSFLTAWANDVGYELVFARQVEAFGRPGDILIGISTSGRSRNLVAAFKAARSLGMACVGLLGGDGGELLSLSDLALVVPATSTQRIQETHILILHLLCELIERQVAPDPFNPAHYLSESIQTGECVKGQFGLVGFSPQESGTESLAHEDHLASPIRSRRDPSGQERAGL